MSERYAFTVPSGSARALAASAPAAAEGPAGATQVRTNERNEEEGRTAFTWTVVFTAILFLRPQDVIPPLEFLHLAEVSAIVALTALVFGQLQRRRPVTRWTPELLGVLAFGAIMLATTPFSIWMGGSLSVFTDLYAKVILVYLLAVNVLDTPARLERLTWVLVLSVGYVGFRAVLDYVRGVNLIGNGTRVMGSIGGIMQNPNDLALNMVTFLPFAAFIAMRPVSPLKRLIAAGCAVSMLGAIVASGSRGGFLGFAAMMLVLAAFAIRRRPAFVVAGALGMICALPILPDSYWRRIESITDSSKDDYQSEDQRKNLFGESFDAFVQYPLTGVGVGEFKDWNPEKRLEAWHESHNVWLQVAAEMGIFGFAVFAFLVFRAFAATIRTRRLLRGSAGRGRGGPPLDVSQSDKALLDSHSAAMCASLVGWFVCAFFASVAYNWTFYYLLVLAAAPRDILRARLSFSRAPSSAEELAA